MAPLLLSLAEVLHVRVRPLLPSLAFAAVVAVAPAAGADEPVPTAHAVAESPQEPRWYGWQNLAADGAGVLGVIALRNDAGAAVFVGSYFLGSPLVHAAHGRPGAALASLGLRVVVPLTMAYVGCLADDRKGGFGCLDGMAYGLLAGYVTALVVDTGPLAWEDVPRRPKERLTLAPTATVAKNVVGLGVIAVF